jgi:hypothetical protein
MKKFVAIAASLGINLGVLVALENSAENALPVPSGEVTVVELDSQPVPTLAQAPAIESSGIAL